jgi:hypothetical protein
VEQGESFTVMRRSRPAFTVTPFNEDNEGWTTLIDFNDGGKKKGISAKTLLKKMKEFEKKYGQNS